MRDLDVTALAARLGPSALEEHGLAPLVFAATSLPALRDVALRAAAVEPLRLADLRKVLAALRARGIEALILKGTALAYDLYDAPEQRPRGDIDLLVDRTEMDAVRDVFHELGFRERLTSGDEHGLRQQLFLRTDDFGVEHAYDVHWEIANQELFAGTLTAAELRPRAHPLPRISPLAFGLPRAEALLHACIHRIAHHHDDERLIWLVDIQLLRGAMPRDEHARFWRLAAERGVVGVCLRSVAVTEEWLGVRGPHAEEFLSDAELGREEPTRVYLAAKSRGGVLIADLRSLPWRARLQRLWQLAFPPREFMRASFSDVRAPLPLLYVWRGVRGMARLFRKARA
jgi:hypothetical protein